MKHRKVMFVILFSIFAITVNQSYLWSGEPGVLVKRVILNEASFSNIDDISERKAKQWESISPSLNFEIISKRVMGEYWDKCLHEEQREFVKLFTSHLRNTYIKKANPLFGNPIISLREKQFNNFAKVQTLLLVKFDREISADFYLIREKGEWKICDLVIKGVSLVNNYHRQIANTLVRTSYEGLLRTIKDLQVEKYRDTEKSVIASNQ